MTHDGVDAAQNQPVQPGQAAWMETTVPGPGIVRFLWKTAGSNSQVALLVDGAYNGDVLFGATDWTVKVVNIVESRPHTLRWTYTEAGAQDDSRMGRCSQLRRRHR